MSEVIKINTVTASVQIVTTGTQGPAGPKGEQGVQGVQGPIGEVDPTVIENLQNQITDVQTLAQTNDLKIGTKADQVDLETAEQQIELNRLAILTKADITAVAMLAQLVDTKADQAYVNQQISNLVGSAPEALNTVYELATAIQDNAGVINTLNQSVANRVRFDVATQALTEIQKQNARTNIGAETLGTAATLVAAITAASIGAATAAQGTKADTALQSADVAPVALSGLFNSLVGQNKIFDVVFGAYALGSNTAVVATDTLGQIIGKLQAQINNKAPPTWVSAVSIGSVMNQCLGMEFAKIDGNLWVRGRYQSATSISTNTIFFVLTDARYRIEAPEAPSSDLIIGSVQANTSFTSPQYMDVVASVNPDRYYFKLRARATFSAVASPNYAVIQPTPIGKLLTP